MQVKFLYNLVNSVHLIRYIINNFAVYVSSALIVYIISSYTPQILNIILPLNESRPWKRIYQSYYYLDSDKYFFYILFHEQMAISLSITTVVCVDSTYVKYAEHACCMFSILR